MQVRCSKDFTPQHGYRDGVHGDAIGRPECVWVEKVDNMGEVLYTLATLETSTRPNSLCAHHSEIHSWGQSLKACGVTRNYHVQRRLLGPNRSEGWK